MSQTTQEIFETARPEVPAGLSGRILTAIELEAARQILFRSRVASGCASVSLVFLLVSFAVAGESFSPLTSGGLSHSSLLILGWRFHILRIFLHLSPRHFPLPLPHFCSHRSSLGSSRSHSAQSISVSQHGRNSSNCTSSTKSYSSQVWNLNQHRSLFRPQKSRWAAQSHQSRVA